MGERRPGWNKGRSFEMGWRDGEEQGGGVTIIQLRTVSQTSE